MSGKLLCFKRIALHPALPWGRPREGLSGRWKRSRRGPELEGESGWSGGSDISTEENEA